MTVYDLCDALEDTAALVRLAKRADITLDQARRFAADLADLPVVQVVRICTTAQADRARQRAREQRKRP